MNDNKYKKKMSLEDIASMELRTEEQIMSSWNDPRYIMVSCCSICFNQENYVELALKSMLMQITEFAIEIIIRDDASTDYTTEIIKQYQARYPNIIKPILESENGYKKGLRPRMIVMNQARGKYIAPLDCDDLWMRKDKLQRQVDFLRDNDEFVMCFHNAVVVNSDNEIIKESVLTNANDLSSNDLIIGRSTILPSFTVFKNIGFSKSFPPAFDGTKNGDTITWHLLGFSGACKFIPGFNAGAFRVHSKGQNTGLSNFHKMKNRIETREAIIHRLRELRHQDSFELAFKAITELVVNDLSEMLRNRDFKSFYIAFGYLYKKNGFKLPLIYLRASFSAVFASLKKWLMKIL